MDKKKNQLPFGLVEQILMKLGINEQPSNDIRGLTGLYKAWCQKVSFDNILKRIHLATENPAPLPGHSEAEFFKNWLRYGTGGLCWAGNAALHSLLEALGFSSSRGIATMLIGTPQAPDHGTVAVQFEDQRFLVDASILHNSPFELLKKQRSTVEHPAWGVTCTPQKQKWVVSWRPLHILDGCDCRIENFPASRTTFQQFNEITRTVSPFNSSLYVRFNTQETATGIVNDMAVEFTASGEVLQTPLSSQSKQQFLVEVAGISEEIVSQIPPDTAKL